METFESLAQADVASFLYNNLKYFQDLQTVFATVNLRLEDLERESQKRDDVINYIKESYVSASNKNQPYLYCI
jgi:peptidase E